MNFVPYDLPSKPTLTLIEANINYCTIKWEMVITFDGSNILGYKIYSRKASSDNLISLVYNGLYNPTNLSFSLLNLDIDSTYEIFGTSVNESLLKKATELGYNKQ